MQPRTRLSINLALALPIVVGASTLTAQPKTFPQTTVHYSATQTIENGPTTITFHVRARPGKTRSEMEIEGMEMTSIVRQDLGVVWSVMAGGTSYMELAIGEGSQMAISADVELQVFERKGSDDIDGRRADHYYFETPGGVSAVSGDVWLSKENIPLRTEVQTGEGITIIMTLSDLEIGNQPDDLFELPAGATKIANPMQNR